MRNKAEIVASPPSIVVRGHREARVYFLEAHASPRDFLETRRARYIGGAIKGAYGRTFHGARFLFPSPHVIHTVLSAFSPLADSRARARSETYLGFLAPARCTAGLSRSCAECPFIFIFAASPVALFLPIFI